MTRLCCLLLIALDGVAQTNVEGLPLPPRPQAGKGVLAGTVINGATHEPLRKAQVTLGGNLHVPPTAITDASGRFVFRELPQGIYWLSASKSGYNVLPGPIELESNPQLSLGDGEEKDGVEIALLPDGTISGRVLNEEGDGVRNCSVTVLQFGYEQGRRKLLPSSGTSTDDRGEYRLADLMPGRYLVSARCAAELAAAHPLLPRGDPRTPHDTYRPQFYGGGPDPATATKLTLQPGTNLDGIDFEMRRIPSFTLRGSYAASDPEDLSGMLSISLLPANIQMQWTLMSNASSDSQAHTFEIHPVIPGSYILTATALHGNRVAAAERIIEIGNSPPGPVELMLAAGVDLKGSLQFDVQDQPHVENAQIFLMALEERTAFRQQQPQTQVNKDGTFTFTGVLPGRFHLASSLPGYFKSVSLGGQAVSPYGFQIGPGASGPLRVVMSDKRADVNVSVTGAPPGRPVSVVAVPEDPERLGMGLERVQTSTGGDRVALEAMQPGRYRLLATDVPNPWPLTQSADLWKALENRTPALDVPEEGRVNVTAEVVTREELLRALEEKD